MTCKYCSGKLAPLRSLTDGEFCSDEHRHAYYREHSEDPVEAFQPPDHFNAPEIPMATAWEAPSAPAAPEFSPPSGYRVSFAAQNEPVAQETPRQAFSQPSEALAAAELPPSTREIEDMAPPAFLDPEPSEAPKLLQRLASASHHRLGCAFQWLATAWITAPKELRAMALFLPVLLALACSPLLSKLETHLSGPNVLPAQTRRALTNQWKLVQTRISQRAAVAITDDFRTGLDSWQSRSNLTSAWSYDKNGFVQPGPLAILKPTLELTDYSFEFLGEIQHRGLGCAFRARDLNNYYAVKFLEDDSGPLPAMRLVRYAVINGREGQHVERLLPSSVRADMFNRFRVEAHGSDFTILVQGEVVDFFSDAQLPSGGVGFFCSRGESARLRWMEVAHQYDTLGRLCAFFSPVSLAGVDKN